MPYIQHKQWHSPKRPVSASGIPIYEIVWNVLFFSHHIVYHYTFLQTIDRYSGSDHDRAVYIYKKHRGVEQIVSVLSRWPQQSIYIVLCCTFCGCLFLASETEEVGEASWKPICMYFIGSLAAHSGSLWLRCGATKHGCWARDVHMYILLCARGRWMSI